MPCPIHLWQNLFQKFLAITIALAMTTTLSPKDSVAMDVTYTWNNNYPLERSEKFISLLGTTGGALLIAMGAIEIWYRHRNKMTVYPTSSRTFPYLLISLGTGTAMWSAYVLWQSYNPHALRPPQARHRKTAK